MKDEEDANVVVRSREGIGTLTSILSEKQEVVLLLRSAAEPSPT
jgi:hypothetical protein